MTKTPVKFKKDWHKTVEGVAHTKYPLLEGRQNHGKPNTMSPHFSLKKKKLTIGHLHKFIIRGSDQLYNR